MISPNNPFDKFMDDLTDIIIKYRWEIVGSLAMAVFVAYLTRRNNRLNRLAIASTTFRNTISMELKGLYPTHSEWPVHRDILDKRLRQVFPNLEIAINDFRPFVPWYRRWTFDRAWIFYHLGECGRDKRYIGKQYYGQYYCVETTTNINGKEITEVTDGKANFKHNVDKLLSYAEQK